MNQNRLKIAESRAILSRVYLMSWPCILKTRALYLTSVEKALEQFLHLLKTENCRLSPVTENMTSSITCYTVVSDQ